MFWNKYDEFKESWVLIENDHEVLVFLFKGIDLEKSRESKQEISCSNESYILTINQNKFNSTTFMLQLKLNGMEDEISQKIKWVLN